MLLFKDRCLFMFNIQIKSKLCMYGNSFPYIRQYFRLFAWCSKQNMLCFVFCLFSSNEIWGLWVVNWSSSYEKPNSAFCVWGLMATVTLQKQSVCGIRSLCLSVGNSGPFEPVCDKTCLMAYANNKDADRTVYLRSLTSVFVIRFLDGIIHLSIIRCYIQNFQVLASFCNWAGLFESATLKTGFLMTWFIPVCGTDRIVNLLKRDNNINRANVHQVKTQISLSIQSDQSSLCALWVVKDQYLLQADSENSNQTNVYPGWSESSLGTYIIFLVLSCYGSFWFTFSLIRPAIKKKLLAVPLPTHF